MLFKYLRPRARPEPGRVPRVPAGERVYAIGDVHGRLDLLDELLERIAEDDDARDARSVTLIFLGDLIDRGPASRGVIDRVLALRDEGIATRVLCGNHEEVFLKVLDGNEEALRFFTRIGGRETILSYGIDEHAYATLEIDELLAAVQAAVPPAHVDLLRGCEDSCVIGDYLFVHAGIRPGVPLEGQTVADLRWIRNEFLNFRGEHPWVVIHGHTPAPEVERPGNRINVDTGAYIHGTLSAVALEEDEQRFLYASGEPLKLQSPAK